MSLLSFFGESATEQKNGYVYKFFKLINNLNYEIEKHDYGSMHIRDAGICFVSKALESKPLYLFIDWFTTGFCTEPNDIQIYLDTILYACHEVNCQPVILLLDRKDIKQQLKFIQKIVKYCDEKNVYHIDIFNNKNQDEILSDFAKTTDEGSELYANKIYDFFMANIHEKKHDEYVWKVPAKTMYNNIKYLEVNKNVYDKLVLEGTGKLIGIYQVLGSQSGIVNIYDSTGAQPKKEYLWDKWCNFDRRNIRIASDVKIKLTIEPLQDIFDKSSCDSKVQWNKIKYMKVIGIFYTGNVKISYINDYDDLDCDFYGELYPDIKIHYGEFSKDIARYHYLCHGKNEQRYPNKNYMINVLS